MTFTSEQFEQRLGFFPYGVQYYRQPTPLPDEWEKDLKEIARSGYTHIQLRPHWRWHEARREQAVWDDLDALMDLAHKHNVRVIMKPMLETAPDWVFQELGGTRIGFHGVPLSPGANGAYYVGGWWPCFDNPLVLAAAGRFVSEMALRYQAHPALWMWDAWNEPVSRPMGQCHCKHSAQSYREWLIKRYGTIGNLNETLGKRWTSFETLMPPESTGDYIEMMLWRSWAETSITNQVAMVADAIHSRIPEAIVITHLGWGVGGNPVETSENGFELAKVVNRVGVSWGCDHKNPGCPSEEVLGELGSAWMRRIEPSWWCHEFYPKTCGHWRKPTDPRVLRRLIWRPIAGGANSLTFWQYRAERVGSESNDNGMREINGDPTKLSGVCDEIAGILAEHAKDISKTTVERSEVALLYHRESEMIMRLQEMPDSPWGHGTAGNAHVPSPNGNYRRAWRSAYAAHISCGGTAEIVLPGDDLGGFKLLHITGAEIVDKAMADWLRDFVRNGGTLLVEFPFACRDSDTSWVSPERPNNGLEDLLGCREGERWETHPWQPATATFDDGSTLNALGWYIALKPCGGKVFATWQDGTAAAVTHSYGRGVVITLGISPSMSYPDMHRDTWDEPAMKILWKIIAGFHGREPKAERLWIRRRIGKDKVIWFLFNTTKDTELRYRLPAKPSVIWTADNPLTADNEVILPPDGVWVGELKPDSKEQIHKAQR